MFFAVAIVATAAIDDIEAELLLLLLLTLLLQTISAGEPWISRKEVFKQHLTVRLT